MLCRRRQTVHAALRMGAAACLDDLEVPRPFSCLYVCRHAALRMGAAACLDDIEVPRPLLLILILILILILTPPTSLAPPLFDPSL